MILTHLPPGWSFEIIDLAPRELWLALRGPGGEYAEFEASGPESRRAVEFLREARIDADTKGILEGEKS